MNILHSEKSAEHFSGNQQEQHPEIKIALAQLEIEPGRPDLNVARIIEIIKAERQRLTDLVVFPEMAVSGYMLGDKWESRSFVEDLAAYNQEIAAATEGITAIWGNLDLDHSKINHDGTVRKYNAALVAQNGQLLPPKVYKTNLPTYRQFHDARHFTSAAELAREQHQTLADLIAPVEIQLHDTRIKLGLLLCEDMWWEDYGPDFNVARILQQKGVDLLINLSCSPWGLNKNNKRHRVVKNLLPEDQQRPPFLYVNNVGMQDIGKTLFHFDGGTTAYDQDGKIIGECRRNLAGTLHLSLQQGQISIEPNTDHSSASPEIGTPATLENQETPIQEIKQALISSMKKFAVQNRMKRIIIGLSGGIDSAVSAALWSEVIGAENVFAVNMPTRYNSSTTKNIAELIAHNLGVNYSVVPIENDFNNTVKELEEVTFQDASGLVRTIKLSGLNKENIQSRLRGSTVLSGLASALGAYISCNGNKVEFAYGYATLYGDIIGALAPLGDLLKGQVYDLAREINRESSSEIIHEECLTLIASAELSEDQNIDQGKGDPFLYPYHDTLTRHFVEWLHQPEDILKLLLAGKFETLGVSEEQLLKYFGSREKMLTDLEHKWTALHKNVFKRYQAPPIIKVSSRAFGYDFHESQVPAYFSRRYQQLKTKFLEK
jgi:NAD+ synthase (glutamine-hydrolysing)